MICVRCQKFLRPEKNGVVIEEMAPRGGAARGPHTLWGPYKLWEADLRRCPECGVQVVGGFGFEPIAEHFEARYAPIREGLASRILLQVRDCGAGHSGPRPRKKRTDG